MKPATTLLAAIVACAGPGTSADPAYSSVIEASDLEGRAIGDAPPGVKASIALVFATWCEPCREELRVLERMQAADPRLRVIGINAYETWGDLSDLEKLRAYLDINAPWLRVVIADESLLAALGGVPRIPSVFVFDSRGRLVNALRRTSAPPTESQLRAAIQSALR